MKHPPIIVLGYSEAAKFLRGPGGLAMEAVIAIHGQREFAVDAIWAWCSLRI